MKKDKNNIHKKDKLCGTINMCNAEIDGAVRPIL